MQSWSNNNIYTISMLTTAPLLSPLVTGFWIMLVIKPLSPTPCDCHSSATVTKSLSVAVEVFYFRSKVVGALYSEMEVNTGLLQL